MRKVSRKCACSNGRILGQKFREEIACHTFLLILFRHCRLLSKLSHLLFLLDADKLRCRIGLQCDDPPSPQNEGSFVEPIQTCGVRCREAIREVELPGDIQGKERSDEVMVLIATDITVPLDSFSYLAILVYPIRSSNPFEYRILRMDDPIQDDTAVIRPMNPSKTAFLFSIG